MIIPQDVIDHCEKHPGCKGCPLRTCTAPLAEASDPRWGDWVKGRIEAVRDLYRDGGAV